MCNLDYSERYLSSRALTTLTDVTFYLTSCCWWTIWRHTVVGLANTRSKTDATIGISWYYVYCFWISTRRMSLLKTSQERMVITKLVVMTKLIVMGRTRLMVMKTRVYTV